MKLEVPPQIECAGIGLIHFCSHPMNLTLRQAVAADVSTLRVLIDASVRGLQAADYTPTQIEGALQTVYGVDSQLIADGTYFVVEAGSAIVGCGGWSRRKTLFGGDRWTGREDALLDPRQDAAKIRAFFVHPSWVRRGIGSMILEACERAAIAAGFTRLEMGATLTGMPLYRARGYVSLENLDVPLQNGNSIAVVRMEKRISLKN
jgi:GNAT superfamily N-acetyltransferase